MLYKAECGALQPLGPDSAESSRGEIARQHFLSPRHARESRHPGLRALIMHPCVYILASDRNGTLYTGVTSNLTQRIWAHRSNGTLGFTNRYHVHRLVHVEVHETMEHAIVRE